MIVFCFTTRMILYRSAINKCLLLFTFEICDDWNLINCFDKMQDISHFIVDTANVSYLLSISLNHIQRYDTSTHLMCRITHMRSVAHTSKIQNKLLLNAAEIPCALS